MVGPHDGKYQFHRSRCKGYHCGRCGPKKIRQVRKRIVSLAVAHGLTRFLTLTLDPKKLPPGLDLQSKIEYLRACWSKMRVYIKRKLGKSVQFIAVMELQQNGNPHLHALIGSYLNKDWVSASWQALGGGSFTRIEFADIHRVAAYVAKYVSDEHSLLEIPRGIRRFSSSRDLRLFERSKSDTSWDLVRRPIERLYDECPGIELEERSVTGELLLFIGHGPPFTREAVWTRTHWSREHLWALRIRAAAQRAIDAEGER